MVPGMARPPDWMCVSTLILSSLHPVEGEHRGYEVIVSVDLDQLAEVESATLRSSSARPFMLGLMLQHQGQRDKVVSQLEPQECNPDRTVMVVFYVKKTLHQS